MMKFFEPAKILTVYSVAVIILLSSAVLFAGQIAVYALMGVQFFLSIMFPTIFALSVKGLGSKTKEGSSLIIMSIVGGAIFPVIMGRISDVSNIQLAYIVPALCMLMVLYFGVRNMRRKEYKLSVVR